MLSMYHLGLSECAMASGARSLYAIAQWGRMQDPATLKTLGFTRDRTPAVSTLHKVFSSMDVDSFERVLGEWIEPQFVRGYWGIENGLHYVRDLTMEEDGSCVHTGPAPQVMASLRNVVIDILLLSCTTNIASAIRTIGWQSNGALRMLGLKP